MHNLRAIETVYKGCRFRSRLEARWAIFFDALSLEWEYERSWDIVHEVKAKWDRDEGCYVEDDDPYDDPSEWDEDTPTIKTGYCPDFFIPNLNIWIEVKPKEPTIDERNKAKRWAETHKAPIVVLFQPLEPIGAESDANWGYRGYVCKMKYIRWYVGDKKCKIGIISPDDYRQKDIRLLEAYNEAARHRF